MPLLVPAVHNRVLERGHGSVLPCLFAVPISKSATDIFIFPALLGAVSSAGMHGKGSVYHG